MKIVENRSKLNSTEVDGAHRVLKMVLDGIWIPGNVSEWSSVAVHCYILPVHAVL